jgi:hypothetical protein
MSKIASAINAVADTTTINPIYCIDTLTIYIYIIIIIINSIIIIPKIGFTVI